MAEQLTWRRTWKPDLESQPWRNLKQEEGKTLFIKSKFTNNSYEVLVTDLGSFWYEELSENALTKRISKLNPSIEAPLGKILSHIETSLQGEVTVAWKESSSSLQITLNSDLARMPFTFIFETAKTEEDMGKTHLVCPLMSMVGELYRQQSELFKIVAAKDKEIDDYKSQGVKASRRHMVTPPFDVLAFRNNMLTSKDFEEEVRTAGKAFTLEGQSLYREIATKRAWIASKTEPSDPNDDPSATPDPTVTSAAVPSVESWASRLPTSLVQRHVSPAKSSPTSSPAPSPASSRPSSTEVTPVKDTELLRRQALERKLADEDTKQQEKAKKKKKLKF